MKFLRRIIGQDEEAFYQKEQMKNPLLRNSDIKQWDLCDMASTIFYEELPGFTTFDINTEESLGKKIIKFDMFTLFVDNGNSKHITTIFDNETGHIIAYGSSVFDAAKKAEPKYLYFTDKKSPSSEYVDAFLKKLIKEVAEKKAEIKEKKLLSYKEEREKEERKEKEKLENLHLRYSKLIK